MYIYRYTRTNTYRTYLRATNTFAETHTKIKHGIKRPLCRPFQRSSYIPVNSPVHITLHAYIHVYQRVKKNRMYRQRSTTLGQKSCMSYHMGQSNGVVNIAWHASMHLYNRVQKTPLCIMPNEHHILSNDEHHTLSNEACSVPPETCQ